MQVFLGENYIQKITSLPYPDTPSKLDKYPTCSVIYITNDCIKKIIDVYRRKRKKRNINVSEVSSFVATCFDLDDCVEKVQEVLKEQKNYNKHKGIQFSLFKNFSELFLFILMINFPFCDFTLFIFIFVCVEKGIFFYPAPFWAVFPTFENSFYEFWIIAEQSIFIVEKRLPYGNHLFLMKNTIMKN